MLQATRVSESFLGHATSPPRRHPWPATGFESPRNFLKPEFLAALFKLFCRTLIFSTKMFKQCCKDLGVQKVSSGTRPQPPAGQATGFESPRNFLKFCQNAGGVQRIDGATLHLLLPHVDPRRRQSSVVENGAHKKS